MYVKERVLFLRIKFLLLFLCFEMSHSNLSADVVVVVVVVVFVAHSSFVPLI